MILNGKYAKDFIKRFYDLNQIIKTIYKNEPNFKPTYIFTNTYITYFDFECIPEYVLYHFNKPIVNKYFKVTVDSKLLFDTLKDTSLKNAIDKVIIEKDSIELLYLNETVLKFDKDNTTIKNFISNRKEYRKNLKFQHDYEAYIPPEIINSILNIDDKKLNHLIFNFDSNQICFYDEKPDDIESYLEFFLNKKFLLGASYKIKKLKSGDKIEYTPVKISIHDTDSTITNDNNDIYDMSIQIKLKNDDVVEHHFMVIDF